MIRTLSGVSATVLVLATLAGCADPGPAVDAPWTLTRSPSNPLITPDTRGNVIEWDFPNINGPSVIRVPEWAPEPLGRYYMYFGHHRGSFIRMAYAEDPEGPWTIHDGGVLALADTPALDHISSPEVIVDSEARTFRMYYHSVDDTTTWKQTTYLAKSGDGLSFESGTQPLGPPYLRVWEINGQWWGLAKVRFGPGGVLLRAAGPDGPFEEGPQLLERMRHAAVLPIGDQVTVVFSRIGDEPERLLRTTFNPEEMWDAPHEPEIHELMRPETTYEGGDLPIVQSAVGETMGPVNALRDPYIFVDEPLEGSESGRHYLYYSIAGEHGIAMARIGLSEEQQE